MRYYPAVGPAIPHKSVGCSRVTHPFAGEVLLPPLDLHVLSTPPAFVLSQDQTLQESQSARSNSCPTLSHLAMRVTACPNHYVFESKLSPMPLTASDRRVASHIRLSQIDFQSALASHSATASN